MRVIGLDLGNRTVGIALSDYLGIIANPVGTFRVIKENDVQKIVLGFPKNMNGTIGPQAEYCLKFKGMLEEATKLEVIMIDERLTSRQADVIMLSADMSRNKRKKNVDKLAATIILQTYLDQKR